MTSEPTSETCFKSKTFQQQNWGNLDLSYVKTGIGKAVVAEVIRRGEI